MAVAQEPQAHTSLRRKFTRMPKKSWTAELVFSRAPISAESVSAVSVIRGLPRPEKNGKLKK
jgi:hypothetical protein